MTFIFETSKRVSERECTMEEAIDTCRRRVLDGMVDYIVLSVKTDGEPIKLGSYYPGDVNRYIKQFPEVECVEAHPMLHRIPKEEYYNAAAWRLPKSAFNRKK